MNASNTVLSTPFSKATIFAVVGLLAPFGVLSSVLLSSNNPVEAAINEQLHFQARLLTSSGSLPADGDYNVQFNIYSGGDGLPGTTDETLQWTGSYLRGNTQAISVANGYVSANLGESGSSQVNTLSDVPWDNGTLWLSINIGDASSSSTTCTTEANFNANCGGDGEMGPFIRLGSTPYAFNSKLLDGRGVDEFVQLDPGGTSQAANTANTIIDIDQAGAGDLINLEVSSSQVLGLSNAGNLTVSGDGTFGDDLVVNGDSITTDDLVFNLINDTATTLNIGGAATTLEVGAATGTTSVNNALTVDGLGTFSAGLTVSTGSTFTNASSSLFTAVAIADVAAGGDIDTAANSVDVATTFNINQTTASQTLSLPTPTVTTAGRVVYVNNVGSTSFVMHGSTIASGASNAFIWNGSNWITSVSLSSSVVNSVGTIDTQTKSADGAVISANAIYLQTADATAPGLVSTGAQTIAGAKTFNADLTLAADQSLILTGSGTLPGSPTEGEIYYDSTNNEVLIYNGSQWERLNGSAAATFVVAPTSNAKAELADYRTNGTSDETEINAALAALPAGGGTVYLMEGTYTIDGSIEIDDNQTLVGAGESTIIFLANSTNANENLIENIDSAGGNNNITIRNLLIDGNDTNQDTVTYSYFGIDMTNVGSGTAASAVAGVTIENVVVQNLDQNALRLDDVLNSRIRNNKFIATDNSAIYTLNSSSNLDITNNEFYDNNYGVYATALTDSQISGNYFDTPLNNGVNVNGSSGNVIISNNTIQSAGSIGLVVDTSPQTIVSDNLIDTATTFGIYVTESDYTSLTGNTIDNATRSGIFSNNVSHGTYDGNTINSPAEHGILLQESGGSSDYLTVTNNTVYEPGSTNNFDSIYLCGPDYARIIGNNLYDTAGSGDAIDVDGCTEEGTYLADNVMGGRANYLVNDDGSNTIFATQLTALDVLRSDASEFTSNQTITLTGSIDPAASTTVTGVGTNFDGTDAELQIGDRIVVTGETRTVVAIASDTSLTVDTAFSDNANDTSPDRLPASLAVRDTSGDTDLVVTESGQVFLPNLDCTGNTNGGVLTTDANGQIICDDDDAGASSVTLQDAYDADTDDGIAAITLTATDGEIAIRDAASTIGDLFVVESNDGSTDYLVVNSSSATLGVNTSINGNLAVDSTDLFVNSSTGQIGVGKDSGFVSGSLLNITGGDLIVDVDATGRKIGFDGLGASESARFEFDSTNYYEATFGAASVLTNYQGLQLGSNGQADIAQFGNAGNGNSYINALLTIGADTLSANAQLTVTGNRTDNNQGTDGVLLQVESATFTDDDTAGSGTATNAVFNSFATPTLAATNTSVTTTNAANVYIQGAPNAGTNQTITNSYALWVDDGATQLDGDVAVGGNTTIGDANTDTLTINAGTSGSGISFGDSSWNNCGAIATNGSGVWECSNGEGTNEYTVVVAASDSVNASTANYAGDGTDDDVQINAALDDVTTAGGGTVFLLEGTYSIGSSITIDSNTSLVGSGLSTILQSEADGGVQNDFDIIENGDQVGGNSNILLRDFKIDGNNTNITNSTRNSIDFTEVGSGSGATAVTGFIIENIEVEDSDVDDLDLNTVVNSTVRNSRFIDANGTGIDAVDVARLSITNNTLQGMTGDGINADNLDESTINGNFIADSTGGNGIQIFNGAQDNVVDGNTIIDNNARGIRFQGGAVVQYNTISNNFIHGNGTEGISLGTSFHNLVSSNSVYDNDSAGTSGNIVIEAGSDDNQIVGNYIRDVSDGSYAISITGASADDNYLADNLFTNSAGINDAGTGTIYAGQLDTSGDLNLQANSADSIQLFNPTTIFDDLTIDATTDTIQLQVQANTSQTGNIFEVTNDDGSTKYFTVSGSLIDANVQLGVNNGSLGSPGIIFSSDTDTGFYNNGDEIRLAAGGANPLRVSGTQLQGLSGSVGTPFYSFQSDSDTGLYNTGGTVLFASNGVEAASISSGAATFTGNVTATAGQITAGNDSNAGSLRVFEGSGLSADVLTVQLSGTYSGTETIYIPDPGGVADTFCLVNLDNCNGANESTFVVAASDTLNASAADYVATGTSDEDTINSALAALPASGGTVYLMEGNYSIDGEITINSNERLIGSGVGSVITLADNTDTTLDLIDSASDTNVEISNLILDGNKANQASGTINGIHFTTTDDSSIHNVTIIDTEDVGILLTTSDDVRVRDNVISASDAEGIYDNGGLRNQISGNRVNSVVTDGIHISSDESRVTDNTVYNPGNDGMVISGSDGNVIANNTIYFETSNGTSNEGIRIGNNTTDYIVDGNVITNAGTDGIRLSDNTTDGTVSNNRIHNSGVNDGTADGIVIQSSAGGDNRIVDNFITDTAGTGAAIDNDDAGTILSGNYFSGTGADSIQDNGANVLYSSQLTAADVLRSDASEFVSNRSIALTGTVAVSSGSPTVTGTSTDFDGDTGEIKVGDRITIDDTAETYTVLSISSDTVLTLTENVTTTDASSAATKLSAPLAVRDSSGSTDLVVTEAGDIYTPNLTSCSTLGTDGNGLVQCGAALTLQDIYDQDADGSDVTISLTTADDSLIISNPASSGTDSGYVMRVEQLNTGAVAGLQVTSAGTSNVFEVFDDGTFTDTSTFAVNADGNVGVGDNDPSEAKLVVSAGTGTELQLQGAGTATFDLTDGGIGLNDDLVFEVAGSGGTGRWLFTDTGSFVLKHQGFFDATRDLEIGYSASGTGRTIGVQDAQTNVAGNDLTIDAGSAGTGASAFTGGDLILQGGDAAGTGNALGGAVTITAGQGVGTGDGGNVVLTGGSAAGTGTQGLVVVENLSFDTATVQNFTVSGAITQSNLDATGAIIVDAQNPSLEITVPNPSITTAGRLVYVTAELGSNDFTLTLNDGDASSEVNISLRENETATLVWNGIDWTAAGASSSNTLQSAYNNTLTSAGGAEIVLNAPGGDADGFTIRNNPTTPIDGGILEVQSAIGTNLFSVNNIATEYAANGGAEDDGTFSTDWTDVGTTSSSRETSTVATGTGAVTYTANAVDEGVRNNLATDLSTSTMYMISFTARTSSGTWASADVEVLYSRDGGTDEEACTNASTADFVSTTWTKFTCTITTDGTSPSNADLIIQQTDSTTRTVYIDNLSITENSASSEPDNVQIGGGQNGGPVTLFTLDRASAPPVANGNETYLGSMYYDTVTGRIQCYEADGWGACGSAPNNYVNLLPEYPGSVLNGTGVGTMTADFCSNESGVLQVNHSGSGAPCSTAGEVYNYYQWTSPQATQQEYSIYITYQLPAEFGGFESNSTVLLTARTDSTSNGEVSYEMFRNEGGSIIACGTETFVAGTNAPTTTADAWHTVGINGDETDGCGFSDSSADNFVIFKINMKANSNANVYASTLQFTTVGQ